MPTLRDKSERYAHAHGCELLVVEGPEVDRYCAVVAGDLTVLSIDSGTADGSHCGEVIYHAIQAIEAARALRIEQRIAVRKIETPPN